MNKGLIIFLTVVTCQRMQNITQDLNPNTKNTVNHGIPKNTQNLRYQNKLLKYSQFWYEYTKENM